MQAMDYGVRGLGKAAHSSSNQAHEWDKRQLTPKEVQEKQEKIAKIRAESEAKVKLTPWTFAKRNPVVVRNALVFAAFTLALARVAGSNSRTRVVKYWLALCAAIALYQNRAKPLLNDNPRFGRFQLPILGVMPVVIFAANTSISAFCLNLARRVSFSSINFSIPTMRMVMANDELDRMHVLKTNWQNYTKNLAGDQTGFEDAFYELLGRGIFAVDGEEWRDHRKIASHMFSLSTLQRKMESVMFEHANKVCAVLDQNQGRELDVQELFQNATFDTICEVCFGESPGALDESLSGKGKPKFLEHFDKAQCILSMRLTSPPLVWKFLRMFNLGSERQAKKSLGIVHEYLQAVVDRRRAEQKQQQEGGVAARSDLLSLYLNFSQTTPGLEYVNDNSYLKDVVLNFILAGRDTTSSTLTNWIKLVSTHPHVEHKLMQEFDTVLGQHLQDGKRMPTADLLRKCRYADAVFNEVIRMYPPVPIDFRMCNESETWPSGIRVERGDKVGIVNVVISRDPKFWAEPEQFIPERWLNGGADCESRVKRPDEYILPVFWAGNRLCLGKDMARMEVKLFASVLHKRFKFKVAPHREAFINGPVLFYQDGLWCGVEERKQ